MSSSVDLTGDDGTVSMVTTTDRLTALPSELLHMIFDFLFSRHQPDKAYFVLETSTKKRKCSHALDSVAATSKVLRSEVNDWALHFLLQYKQVTPAKRPKAPQKDKTFNALRGRNGLLTWCDSHCIFCGKTTARFAILKNGFHCCRTCDAEAWPDKITKTNALTQYDLREYQLLPNRYSNTSQLKKLQSRFPSGVPSIQYGTYIACGVQTTMFLEKDVKWLARLYHGDLEAHLAMRAAEKSERARKRAETKAAAAKAQSAESTQLGAAVRSAGSTAVDPYYIAED